MPCAQGLKHLHTNLWSQGAGLVLSRLLDLHPASAATQPTHSWAAAASAAASSFMSEFAAHANATNTDSSSSGSTASTRAAYRQEAFTWSPSTDDRGRSAAPNSSAPNTSADSAALRSGQRRQPAEAAAADPEETHAGIKRELYPHRKILEMVRVEEAKEGARASAHAHGKQEASPASAARAVDEGQASAANAALHHRAASEAMAGTAASAENAQQEATGPAASGQVPRPLSSQPEPPSSQALQHRTTQQQQQFHSAPASRRSSSVPVSSVERMARFTGLGLGIAFGTVGSLVGNTLRGSFRSSGMPSMCMCVSSAPVCACVCAQKIAPPRGGACLHEPSCITVGAMCLQAGSRVLSSARPTAKG